MYVFTVSLAEETSDEFIGDRGEDGSTDRPTGGRAPRIGRLFGRAGTHAYATINRVGTNDCVERVLVRLRHASMRERAR